MSLLILGRDCTDMFISYHPFSGDKPANVLKKFKIGTLISNEFPVYKKDTGFYKELCEEVGDYFKKNNLHHKNPIYGLWRLALLLITMYFTIQYMFGIVESSIIVQL